MTERGSLCDKCQRAQIYNNDRDDICVSAAQLGHLECLRYAYEVLDGELSHDVYVGSIVYGNVDCLKYAHKESGEEVDLNNLFMAIRLKQFDCFLFLMENVGLPLEDIKKQLGSIIIRGNDSLYFQIYYRYCGFPLEFYPDITMGLFDAFENFYDIIGRNALLVKDLSFIVREYAYGF
jgi:hypothetical protein